MPEQETAQESIVFTSLKKDSAEQASVSIRQLRASKTWIQIGLLVLIATLLTGNLLRNNGDTSLTSPTTPARSEDKSVQLVNQAVTLISASRYKEALTVLRDAIRANPDDGLAYYNQGVALQFLNLREEAVASYSSALSFNNQDANSYYNRGLALRDLGRLDEAEADLRIAATLKPQWAAAKFNLGQILMSLNKTDEGAEFIAEAKEIDPKISE